MNNAASWSFGEDDARRIQHLLAQFLADSGARTALIVDRTGQLVATVGEAPAFDPTAFATLTAADFSANDQLARLIGESDFSVLFHQGEKESMYLADIARRVILVVLFDERSSLGLVRLRVRKASDELTRILESLIKKAASANAPSVFAEITDDDIDNLFND